MKTPEEAYTEASARVSERKDGWYVQLDLHGNDMDGPYESEDAALEAATEAVMSGETSGTLE